MLHMVSDEQLARMHAHFVVPVVVADILREGKPLEDDEIMAIHATLSDMQPDSALLAMALSAQHMAFYAQKDMIFSNTLYYHADRIVDDYGPFWLMHADNDSRLDEYEDELLSVLSDIPDDLASLIDVLSVARDSVKNPNHPMAVIADIFCKQAEAQQLIASTFLEIMEEEQEQAQEQTRALEVENPSKMAPVSFDPMLDGVQSNGSNVLYFPGTAP